MSNKKRSFVINLKDVENIFKYRRVPYPKRSAEFIALIAVSCTLFLFLHTKSLNSRLQEMEVKLHPEISGLEITGNNAIGKDDLKDDFNSLHGTYKYLKSTGQIKNLNANDLNNTRKAEMDILFFNRVPKVGSEAMMELIKILSRLHKYEASRAESGRSLPSILTNEAQLELVEVVSSIPEPGAYIEHVNYVNFTKFGFPRPIYINLIRDPIERVISWFYYARNAWRLVRRNQRYPDMPIKSPEWLKLDFETCLAKKEKECIFITNKLRTGAGDHRRQTLFFCGHDQMKCMPFNSLSALQIAKQNVEKEYAVVGSWEDTNITLTVLEKYIPKFFKGATALFYMHEDAIRNQNKNKLKPHVTEKTKELLRRNFTREIEFYQFCKQRLYKQYIALNLNKNPIN